jgi:hypothetical protein
MAQPRSRGERKHRQPEMNARLPKSQGHTFAAQAVRGPVGVCFDAIGQECRRQPEAICDTLDRIQARNVVRFALCTENNMSVRKTCCSGDTAVTQTGLLACLFQTKGKA